VTAVTLSDPSAFEMTVEVSYDTRLAPTVRDLATCAAGAAGSSQDAAAAFGRRVEASMREICDQSRHDGAMLPVRLRWHDGAADVRVGDRTFTLDGTG
jgi:hypothetical protein